jgi:YegS/Rv2252/BmrU family lipid kinase
MNRVKFIYNPYSGENSIAIWLDEIINIHQKHGYTIIPFRISRRLGMVDAFKDIDESYKYVLIAGGDGTIDTIVNYMKKNNIDLPIGVLPTGTANDFAKFIGMPTNIEKACKQIINSEVKFLDIGKINKKYFINVASTGLFTDVSQKTDSNLKNNIGKLAYYLKGLEQLPNFRKIKVKVTSKDANFDGEIFLMLVFNGQTAGNINFAYKASLKDGKLDVIIINAATPIDTISLLIKLLKGEHLDNPTGLIYFKTDELVIESSENIVTDIDGEKGPDFPLHISCEKDGLKILGVRNT